MIRYYKKHINEALIELEKAEKGCWISIYPPFNNEEVRQVSEELDIPLDFFVDALDIDERSRYEQEDGIQFIVLNVPVKNANNGSNEALYNTVPLGIAENEDYILTVTAFANPVIDALLMPNMKSLDTNDHSRFVLLMLERVVYYYLQYLKNINIQRTLYEKELYHSSRSEELFKMMNLQKSLVYFVTSLRDNELMFLRMQRTDFLNVRKREDCSDFFEDIIIDISQAQEMSRIYTDILNATLDTFASIISNNMNNVMKRLTSITIILMVPTLVSSFFGMNVPLNLPFLDIQIGDSHNQAFVLILVFSVLLTTGVVLFFRRNRLF